MCVDRLSMGTNSSAGLIVGGGGGGGGVPRIGGRNLLEPSLPSRL